MSHTHTTVYGSLDFVRDNPGELIPDETFTHSHLLWSLIVPYLLHPSNTIHGILLLLMNIWYQATGQNDGHLVDDYDSTVSNVLNVNEAATNAAMTQSRQLLSVCVTLQHVCNVKT